jgi:hypothetical protein
MHSRLWAILTETHVNTWYAMLWLLAPLGLLAIVYGLYRFCRCLENRGWLYYRHQRTTSSAVSCFVALQQVLEPPVKHVH